jgi:3-hydroxyisobutyrate dehydrogenase-like beta-hydroxyacid dehydrogenase
MSMYRLSIIGVGNMGGGMAANLLARGLAGARVLTW